MILAGDIGGTKTILAIYSVKAGVTGGAIHETRYESGKYEALETIVSEFLRETGAQPSAACFGVAGPVKDHRAQITNLPWVIEAEKIQRSCNIAHVKLINDLKAVAVAVPHLKAHERLTLNEGVAICKGNLVVIAPGTGLGIAFLVWAGKRYRAFASEGGHTAFSPRDPREVELLTFLERRYGHVSFERVCSGSQLPNIYDFFLEKGIFQEPEWLKAELAEASDRTPVIIRTALNNKADICEATLDVFVRALGTVISNMAVTLLPTGGIYLGGGIPPRILKRLNRPDFLGHIADKGRFYNLCSKMPVHVIMDPKAALRGAAWYCLETIL